MIKVYFEEIERRRLVPLVYTYGKSNEQHNKNVPFIKKTLEEIQGHFVERASSPGEADFIVVPHTLSEARREEGYLDKIRQLAQEYNKRVLLFSFEDKYEPVDWAEAITFRVSGYESKRAQNEFSLPYIVEDFLAGGNASVRKKSSVPVVGFVGWGRFDSLYQSIRSHVRDFFTCASLFFAGEKNIGVHRKGLLLRMHMIRLLQRSSVVKANFIIRDTYGGNVKTLGKDNVKNAREEFIQNMVDSDTTLSLRGDANASQRFFECLSMGRFPLVIDTDMSFPLPDVIPYDELVIKVPYSERENIAQFVADFFSGLSDEEYAKRQEKARACFVNYLSVNGFYNYLFREEHIWELIAAENTA
jgi:hypothetical protein